VTLGARYAAIVPELRFYWDTMNEQTERIRRVVAVLRRRQLRYALVGGHAVSFHARPRTTVDMDFLVTARALPKIQADLRAAGFRVEGRGHELRAWDASANPEVDEPVVDFVAAENNRAQAEALKTATDVTYQGILLRVVTRPALVALKFISATSASREHGDRLQDAADISRVVKTAWTRADGREAKRIVELWNRGAGLDLARFADDVLNDRPITI
jgi:hypothetical protein